MINSHRSLFVSRFYFVLLIVGFGTNALFAQNKNITLESHSYMSDLELKALLEVIESSPNPKDYNNCHLKECDELLKFRDALLNLAEDIIEYQDYLVLSANVSKKSWESYVEQIIVNEDLNSRLKYNLAFKDFLARLSSLMVDLIDVQNLAARGAMSGNKFEKLFKTIDVIDDFLSYLDVFIKTYKEDLDTNTLTEITGIPNVYTFYTSFKAAFDILKESLTHIDEIKAFKNLSYDDKKLAIRSPSMINVGAAISNLLGIWSNIERDRMKSAIKELDELFKTNKKLQIFHYKKFNLKLNIVDALDEIKRLVYKKSNNLNLLMRGCTPKPFKRESRTSLLKGKDNFGLGLKYYKSLIIATTQNINKSWDNINACVAKPYQINVFSGIGIKRESAYIRIYRKEDGKKLEESSTRFNKKFNLFPGEYNIEIYEGYTKNNIPSKSAFVKNYTITGEEKSNAINLKVYGRVHLDVVNNSGAPEVFRYKFFNKDTGKQIHGSLTANAKKVIVDLPTNINLKLELIDGYNSDIKDDIRLTQGKVTKLRYILDDGKFINTEIKQIETPVPFGWTKGTLYNSNDGDCDMYNGQVLEFNIRDQKIYNLKTGKFVNSVILKPGSKLYVAIPNDGGHFRASPVINGAKENRISFWYYKNATNGWWYSAGCKNGTRPKSRCFNGEKLIDCKTFGD